jgi:hypothetical protein
VCDADYSTGEIKMSVSIKSPIAFAFTVAISLFALPALGAPAHDTGHKPAQNRIADFANASAFVSPETGLSQAWGARMRNATWAASTINEAEPGARNPPAE